MLTTTEPSPSLQKPQVVSMAVIHIVTFTYKPEIAQAERNTVYERFLGLKTLTKGTDGQPYIVDIVGGKENMSKEPLATGMDAAFVVTFQNFADRDYYVEKDPDHAAFVNYVVPMVASGKIFDFET